MHVLRQLHKALKLGGLLLDIHPQPEDPRVVLVHPEGAVTIGAIDWTVDNQEIRDARKRLARVVREGFFRLESRRWFDLAAYHESVEAWLSRREERGQTSPIPEEVLRRARTELRPGEGRLAVVERVRASALRRVDPESPG